MKALIIKNTGQQVQMVEGGASLDNTHRSKKDKCKNMR